MSHDGWSDKFALGNVLGSAFPGSLVMEGDAWRHEVGARMSRALSSVCMLTSGLVMELDIISNTRNEATEQ